MSSFHLLSRSKFSCRIFCGIALALLTGAAARPAAAEDAKPFRTARLTYLAGDVRVEQAGSTTSAKAVVNLPLVEGAVLSTGDDGQAEVEFEDGSLLRLTPHSGAALVNLSIDSSAEYHSRISILGGLAYVELRGGTKFHYLVDAGGDEIAPIENTIVRINFDQPPASISILDGSAHLTAASGSDMAATAGQTVHAEDAADGGSYIVKEGIAPESWDQWNLDRDAAAAGDTATATDVRSKYAGDQGYGWSDLDANGNWYDVPGQGEIWQPDAAAQQASDSDLDSGDVGAQNGFDPYSYGSWAYTPAGYIWASGYGWGWLPYRCGNWNYWDGFGWGWSPGNNCGAYGFGGYFGGGVYIGRAPGTYKRPGRPVPHPGPVHPILHGRGGPVPVAPVHPIDRNVHSGTNERVIAGNVVRPIPRVGGDTPAQGFAGNSRAAFTGGGLRRDYPIDRATNSPVTGVQGRSIYVSPSSNARAAWRSVQPNGQSTTVQRPGYYQPESGSRSATPVVRNAPGASPRPSAPAPAPRSAPAPAPASHPAAASSHGK